MDRVLDVLEAVMSGIDQGHAEMLAGFAIGFGGDRNAARGGDRLEADGDVDVVSEQFVLVGHHVAHVDAEPKVHGAIRRELVVAFGHQPLHRDRGLGGADHARELEQEPVAGIFHDAATVIENDRMDRAAMGLERGMGSGLIGTHHARIAGDIGANDGGETSFHTLRCSGNPMSRSHQAADPVLIEHTVADGSPRGCGNAIHLGIAGPFGGQGSISL